MPDSLAKFNTALYGEAVAKKLTKEDWVLSGLSALAEEGPSALKADRLARRLNVSRGSFYWHFKSLALYHSAVLEGWSRRSTFGIIEELELLSGSQEKLHELLAIAFQADPALERGIRAWATKDNQVAKSVERIDQTRIGFLTGLLAECEVPIQEAHSRAVLLYLANLGRLSVSDEIAHAIPLETLQDLALPKPDS